jgi:hypothetical protein
MRKESIGTRVTAQLARVLRHRATRSKRSLSDYLRLVLEEHVARALRADERRKKVAA